MKSRVKVCFRGRKGDAPETAWCVPLGRGRYRLDNLLFLHATPVYGDVVEAADLHGQLTCKKVVERGGRYAMAVDYFDEGQLEPLSAFLKERFGAATEGCYGPRQGLPGRLVLAVPGRHGAKAVFAAASKAFAGLEPLLPPLKVDAAKVLRRVSEPRVNPLPLFEAVRKNDRARLARVGPEALALHDERGRPLLFLAVLEGRTALVRRLVALGADLNPEEYHPLHAAAMRNRPREARLLMAAGSDPSAARDKDGDPALVTAAFRENLEVLRALLGSPHSGDAKSLALLEAAGSGSLPCVRLLVKHGADPDWVSSRGNSARAVARKKRRMEIVRFFEELRR